MRLLNLEAFEQALMVGRRERMSREVYRGFFVRLNPLRYGLLLGLTYLPAPLRSLLRTAILRSRSVGRRLRGQAPTVRPATAPG